MSLHKYIRKNAVFLAVSIITVFLMLLAWPMNIRLFSISATGTDEIGGYISVSKDNLLKQEFSRTGEYLDSIELWLSDLLPGQTGEIEIRLWDDSEHLLGEYRKPLESLSNNSFNRIQIGSSLEENKKYTLEITGSNIREDSFSLGLLPPEGHIQGQEDSCYSDFLCGQELAANYYYKNTMNRTRTLMWWLILGIIWLVLTRLIYGFSAEQIVQAICSLKVMGQITAVLGIASLFCFASALSPAVTAEKSLKTLWPGMAVCLLFLLLLSHLKKRLGRHLSVPGKITREQLPALLMLIVSCAVRLPMLGTMQRWDAGEYYYRLGTACEKYDFTIQSIFDNFRLCGHSNLGFSLVMAVGEFLNPRGIKGVLLLNLLLTLAAIYCIFVLIKEYWLKCTSWLAAGFALTVSFTPIFLGTFAYINTDYQMALYFVFLLFAEYKGWHILSWLAAVLLSQCKETGVIVIMGYYGLKLLHEYFREKGNPIQRAWNLLEKSSLWIALMAGWVYAAAVWKVGKLTTWVQNKDAADSVSWSNEKINCFGFHPAYIICKMKQYFLSNFAWLATLLILCCLLTVLFRLLSKRQTFGLEKYTGFIGAMSGFVLIGFFYITGGLNRYNILFALGWSIAGILLYYHVFGHTHSKQVHAGIVFFFCAVFFVQSFWNIDGISSLVFKKARISEKNSFLFTDYDYLNGPYYGDSLVNNYQYTWIDKALNKFLREIQYDGNAAILLPREEGAGLHVNGNGNVYIVVWDQEKQKRVMKGGGRKEIPIHVLGEESISGSLPFRYDSEEPLNDSSPSEVYIPFFKYYQADEKKILFEIAPYYYIGKKERISCYGGEIEYYHAIKKDEYYGYNLQEAGSQVSEVKTISKEDLNQKFVEELLACSDISDALINRRLLQKYQKKTQAVSKKRNIIRKGDIVRAAVRVRDSAGKYLGVEYIGNYNDCEYIFELGQGLYLDEIENALIGAKLYNTIKVICRIPENYLPALEYQGENLEFFITPLKINGNIKSEKKYSSKLYKETKEELERQYLTRTAARLAWELDFDSLNRSSYELKQEISQIKRFYKKYLTALRLSEQEFLKDYLHMEKEDYENALLQTAKASISQRYINIRLLGYYAYMQEQQKKQEKEYKKQEENKDEQRSF